MDRYQAPTVGETANRRTLDDAIAEDIKVKQAANVAAEGVKKFTKIENGSVSDVIILSETNNNVLGARWWCNVDKQRSYLSIMNFKRVQCLDGNVAYEPIDFGKRISLTLADFGSLRDRIPIISDQYYVAEDKDKERAKVLRLQMQEIEAAANSMRAFQKQQLYGGGSGKKFS